MNILGLGGKEVEENTVKEDGMSSVPPASAALPENGTSHSQVTFGKTLVFRGELSGDEDLTIDGRIEGKVDLKNHHLVVGTDGNISGEVEAKTVTIIGRMEGNVSAKERVEIRETGSLQGDIRAPRMIIADGAKFKGCVDMEVEGSSKVVREEPKKSTSNGNKAKVSD